MLGPELARFKCKLSVLSVKFDVDIRYVQPLDWFWLCINRVNHLKFEYYGGAIVDSETNEALVYSIPDDFGLRIILHKFFS